MNHNSNETFLHFDNVYATYCIEPILNAINWHWRHGEQWALLGGNGAGKTALAKLIIDQLRPQRGYIERQQGLNPERDIIHLSFDLQRRLIEHDARYDDSECREDAFDVGTTVRQIVLQNRPASDEFLAIIQLCGISHILDRGIRYVSTGESRKTLLASALMAKPRLLILDNPYEGLDKQSQQDLSRLIDQLLHSDIKLLLLVSQVADLPGNISHIMLLNQGRVETLGPREVVLSYLKSRHSDQSNRDQQHFDQLPPARERCYDIPRDQPLISLRHVQVHYGDQIILNDINWDFAWGQHCCISGPNGAGKSTLLSLICGDNHKAYGQDITLFGKRRGSGESIWEIKEKFGIVSTALQLNHIGRLRINEVIASGLFDTVGLYQNCQGTDRKIVQQWLHTVELEDVAERFFQQLSFGQQRLAMLARAMVKSPLILVLDEPCLGLDDHHRQYMLTLIDRIAERGDCHILYVSHTANEMPSCISQRLQLIESEQGGFTAEVHNE